MVSSFGLGHKWPSISVRPLFNYRRIEGAAAAAAPNRLLSLNGFDRGGGHFPCKSFKWPSSFILGEEIEREREGERREELITQGRTDRL